MGNAFLTSANQIVSKIKALRKIKNTKLITVLKAITVTLPDFISQERESSDR